MKKLTFELTVNQSHNCIENDIKSHATSEKENKNTWICQAFHHFMQRIRTQTHLTPLTSKLIGTICVLAQLQSLDQKTCKRKDTKVTRRKPL